MSKRLLFGLLCSFLLIGLAACQPKEDPKELALLAAKNTIHASGFSVKTKGDFNIGLISFVLGDVQNSGLDPTKRMTYNLTNAVNFKTKQAEQEFALTIPFQKNSYTLRTGFHLDEDKNQLTVDNNTLLRIAHEMWSMAENEPGSDLFTPEQKKDFSDILNFLDAKLTNTNTTLSMDELFTSSLLNKTKTKMNRVFRIAEDIPSNSFVYSKDKKDEYGQIILTLKDSEVKKLLESSIKDTYKVKKDKSNSVVQEQALNERLSAFNEMKKTLTFTKVKISLLVNEDKQFVHLKANIHLKIKQGTAKTDTDSYSISMDSAFSDYNKPTFSLPTEKNKNLSLEDVKAIFHSKMNSFIQE